MSERCTAHTVLGPAKEKQFNAVSASYGPVNSRIFGSVARGEASPGSEIDIMVHLAPEHPHIALLGISGLTVEVCDVLGREVNDFKPEPMKSRASESALRDAMKM